MSEHSACAPHCNLSISNPSLRVLALALSILSWPVPDLVAQSISGPTLRVSSLEGDLKLDGRLDERQWYNGSAIGGLTMVEPTEGGDLAGHTEIRVLVDHKSIVIGVMCQDPDPAGIVSFSKARDSELRDEDHIKLILDTFLDGRTGYIFALNPSGARYDALVANQGEGENSDWDAIWEAATHRGANGWSAEIRIPIQSLGFQSGLDQWGFNAERRVQRLQETSRWASPSRDARISQASRAGRLTDLPEFDYGLGLTVRPALVSGLHKPAREVETDGRLDPSLDVSQRLGSNLLASATVNTDFAETEVDTRRTNLTRFSLFFPEKRSFFLAGADIFDFGIGLRTFRNVDLLPFHSRRIGLFESRTVPINAGGKVSGRIGNTSLGALAVQTRSVDSLVPSSTMGSMRIKQNVLAESSIGAIATVGDPEGRPGAYTVGADATFQTSRLGGDKNFIIGVWGLATGREGLEGDRKALGGKIDYPNDTWDVALTYKWIGDGFDPSLGFVPRPGVQMWSGGLNYRLRPSWSWVRWMLHELRPTLVTDLSGVWESYRVFTAPVNWLFESGERFEFNIAPEGERLREPFEIAPGVVIPPGEYSWVRYRLEGDLAAKRVVSGRVSWWFGEFYDGSLHQISVRVAVKPSATANLEISGERNVGSLQAGDFTQDLVSMRLQINFSPDLQLNSLVQYDNDSRIVGTNTRMRWTFNPYGDAFLVYNHNVANLPDDWALESNQLLIKVQYAFRM